MNETEQLIKEQLEKLPANLRGAIESVPWKALVQEIGKQKDLDAEEIISLEQEVMFVLYVFESPSDFIKNIIENVGIDEARALEIAELVSEKIFDQIINKAEETKGEEANKTTEGEKSSPAISETRLPEIPLEDLPAIIPNEKVHDVEPSEPVVSVLPADRQGEQYVEKGKEEVTIKPPSSYPAGQDPYREPIG